MKEKPILFSAPMVRAILDGKKTQTRRLMKNQITWCGATKSPYGLSGDRLWVRETWADTNGENGPMVSYRAGGDKFLCEDEYPINYDRYPGGHFTMWCGDLRRGEPDHHWRPSIFMPRWASRITLRITEVRVENLNDITEEDAWAEGIVGVEGVTYENYGRHLYSILWEEINGKKSWKKNPLVWVIKFERIFDAVAA